MGDEPEPMVRIGDAEREAATASLGEHYAAGRLTTEEFEDRVRQVNECRYRSDLVPVFDELPGGAPESARLPGRSPVAATPDRREISKVSGLGARLLAISGTLALIAFFVCGFAFGGWAWAWLFFLVPPAIGAFQRAGDSG